MLGGIVAAALEPDAALTAPMTTSISAEVGPVDELHKKHAHHHDDLVGSPVRGSGAIALAIMQVNASEVGCADELHQRHEHEPRPERGRSQLRGQVVVTFAAHCNGPAAPKAALLSRRYL